MTIHFTPKRQKQSITRSFKPISQEYNGPKGQRFIKVIAKDLTSHDTDKQGNPLEQIAVHNSKTNRWEIDSNKKLK